MLNLIFLFGVDRDIWDFELLRKDECGHLIGEW
jgi:hypothetical protein